MKGSIVHNSLAQGKISHTDQSNIKETKNILAKGSIDHNFLAEGKTFLVVLPKKGNWL